MRAAVDDAEILSRLIRIERFVIPKTGGTSVATTGAADEDDADLAFAKAGFADEGYLLIGSGLKQHLNQIDSIPGDTSPIPLKLPLPVAYPVGTKVAKVIVQDLGYIEEGSATLSGSASVASVGAANAGGKIWNGQPEVGDLTIGWQQRASSPENLLAAYGIDEQSVKGDGTTGNPYRAWIHPDVMGTHRNFAYRLTGLLNDGRSAFLDILNPTPQINISAAFGAKNQPAVWSVGCVYTHKFYHFST